MCCVGVERQEEREKRKWEWQKQVTCFVFSRNIWFHITVTFSEGKFAHDVNIYCALLFVDYMMSTREPISVVKLRDFLLTLWYGVSGLHLVKTENYEMSWVQRFETDILMYLVVIADPVGIYSLVSY